MIVLALWALELPYALVWELCGRDGALSIGTGLLSAGVGVRLGEAGSLSIAVGIQSVRVWVMCGRVGSRACTTGVLSPPRGSTVLFEDCVLLRRYCHHPLQFKWLINRKHS